MSTRPKIAVSTDGITRTYRLLESCFGALWFERSKTPAWGLNGGGDGAGPLISLRLPDGTVENPLKMRARELPAGTVIETLTGGGGGNGDARSRPFSEVVTDVMRGFVSVQSAWDDYGVKITDDLTVDSNVSVPRH